MKKDMADVSTVCAPAWLEDELVLAHVFQISSVKSDCEPCHDRLPAFVSVCLCICVPACVPASLPVSR